VAPSLPIGSRRRTIHHIEQAVVRGGGPNGSFRAYLFTSIRNTAAAWGRTRRETPIDELESIVDPESAEQAADETLDRSLTAHAFRGLPMRWQEVLWYTEIEQMEPAAVAPLLGMRAGAVSQLAFRAREGLREAWIQAHVNSTASESECHWAIGHLGAHTRGNLSTRDQKRLDAHLEDCARCPIVAGEAQDVSARLALVILPLVLGITGAAGYTALLQQGAVRAIAVTGMPSHIVAGGLIASGAGVSSGLEGTSIGGSGAAPGSASSAASGGAISGISALVGAGSAALVVAGVVAAATIVPGLVDASPVTSLPSAGDADGSSISSEVVPGNDIEADEMLVLELPAPDESDDDVAPPAASPVKEEAAPPAASTPVSDEKPAGGAGGDGSEATEPPATPEPEPEPEPQVPSGTPGWEPASQTCTGDDGLVTQYSVPLTGAPNANVRVAIEGSVRPDVTVYRLSADGTATAALQPTDAQVQNAAQIRVSLRYVLGDARGKPEVITLAQLYDGPTCEEQLADPAPDEPAPEESADVAPPADDAAADDGLTVEPPSTQKTPQDATQHATQDVPADEPVLAAASRENTPAEVLAAAETDEAAAPAE
jgi:RNA polymerase sigma factor (sigma-70 family)